MKIIDISVTTTPRFATWEGTEQGFAPHFVSQIGLDSVANVSVITEGAHTGTHLDAPFHFYNEGRTVEALDLETLLGPVVVVEIFGRDKLTAADFESVPLLHSAERVVLKTDNTRRGLLHDPEFHRDYVGIAPSGAAWLVNHGVRLVGIDYLSVGTYGDENPETHRILLGAGVVVIESLLLDEADSGQYTLIALPPKNQGLDGSPCRALLLPGGLF